MSENPKFPYINRELSWLDFNMRVLEEAFEKETPLLERINFLGITASNLDEFFMVRIAGLKEQVRSKYVTPDPSGLTPQQQLVLLNEKMLSFVKKQYTCLLRSIVPALERQSIRFLRMEQLTEQQQEHVEHYFTRILFPVLTPLAVDRSRPFPYLTNKSLNLAVRLKKERESFFAVVQVPSIMPRIIRLPGDDGAHYIFLEDIILCKLDRLFELHDIKSAVPFRLTRNSDITIDEEAEDLLDEIQESIKKRKHGNPVRLEIASGCDPKLLEFLIDMLHVHKQDIYEIPGPLDLTMCMKFSNIDGFDHLKAQPILPTPPADFCGYPDMFEAIRERDRMVYHPFESFDCVVNLLEQAAQDEDVLAIKQTLYRVSGNSPVIHALARAADNGKQVTVVVELKARFDEENNIHWAKELEKAGCHVVYGLSGLKVHCKALLIVRRESSGIRRYLHLGTGNYNDSTARLYTDIGMFTCKESFGFDVSSLFNILTGYSRPPAYNKIVVAPDGLRSFVARMIESETANAGKGFASAITIKVNSLVDADMIRLLYTASQAGVVINLIVRGICCLQAGVPRISDNIRVISIVGQLLEHSRIFIFENAGNPQIYLGSADLMQRNLDRRIELLFPVEEPLLKERVLHYVELMLLDIVNARVMQPDGVYRLRDKRGHELINSQISISQYAKNEYDLALTNHHQRVNKLLSKE
ncbi:MAG: RNA degradosome polyphosphate kinase [Christensenellales bacterium]|jgi:polyphosphate kinase